MKQPPLHRFRFSLGAAKTACLLIVSTLATITIAHPVSADVPGWDAGNIISDGVFTNNTTMSAGNIQAFLNSKVPVCDTNGTQTSEYGGGTRAQWGQANYGQSKFVCLKDYSEGGRSSAQIIYDVAQKYQINPQVLIVLLQKEQGLVTDTWPLNIQYRTATGYGCPDTAPCDSQYYGLTNQLDWAAKMFRAIMNASPTWYTPYIVGKNFIRYSPTASCGGSNVTIQNRATQALYNYTPYQPNAAALAAGWGTVNCGAYGNRNFYLYFNSWFGSTRGGFTPRLSFDSLSGYPTIMAGKSQSVWIRYKNISSYQTFYKSGDNRTTTPLVLANTNAINRSSPFAASNWPSPSRPTTTFSVYESNGTTLSSDQSSVGPGQIVQFSYNYAPPLTTSPGSYIEWIQPVLEGAGDWDLGGTGYLTLNVTQPTFGATIHSQGNPSTLSRGETGSAWVKYKNIGTTKWYDDVSAPVQNASPLHIANTNDINRASLFAAENWLNTSRPAGTFAAVYESDGVTLAADQHTVNTGQIAKFTFDYKIPGDTSGGAHREWIQPVREGAAEWNIGAVGSIDIDVDVPDTGAKYYRLSGYPSIGRSLDNEVWIDYRNIGVKNWVDDDGSASNSIKMTLTTDSPGKQSDFSSTTWPSRSVIAKTFAAVYESDGVTLASNQHVANPGQVVRFKFRYSAPTSKAFGTYREWLRPSVDGSASNIGGLGFFDLGVVKSGDASFHSFSGYPTVAKGSSQAVWIKYKNTGATKWYDDTSAPANGNKPLHLANTSSINRLSPYVEAGWLNASRPAGTFAAVYESDGVTLASNQHVANPGQVVSFSYKYSVPSNANSGTYREWIQPVFEGANDWNIGGLGYFEIRIP